MKNTLCALALFAGCVTAAVPASAQSRAVAVDASGGFQGLPPPGFSQHWVYNRTPNCARITIDAASPNAGSQHIYIGRGGAHVFSIGSTHELKVRAEPLQSVACSGPHADDLSIIEKGANPLGDTAATLFVNSAGKYELRWGK